MLEGATKDTQTASAEGPLLRPTIAGVELRRTRNIVTRNGITTEVFRSEWGPASFHVEHIIHVQLRGKAVSAWHMHEKQIDRVMVTEGSFRMALYDDREDSPTRGKLDVFNISRLDPVIVTIPPGVWHGLQNMEASTSSFVDFFDHAYRYEAPDEWRLPRDTDQIPFQFEC